MAKSEEEPAEKFTVQIPGDLVREASEEFPEESTIRGRVRQAIRRGIDREQYVRTLEGLVTVLAATNYLLVQRITDSEEGGR